MRAGPGIRCFPEYVEPPTATNQNSYKKDVSLMFMAEKTSHADRTIYYMLKDPDNRIGDVGSNPPTWTSNDNNFNHAGIDAMERIVLPAGRKSVTLTVPYEIMQGFAGDNFIVVASFAQADVTGTYFGNTESTRYVAQNPTGADKPAQSQLLTVWRTLNVELDVCSWPNMPAGDLKATLDGFVATELARACVETREFAPNPNPGPSIKAAINDTEERAALNAGRDISGNCQEFGTLRIVTMSKNNLYGSSPIPG